MGPRTSLAVLGLCSAARATLIVDGPWGTWDDHRYPSFDAQCYVDVEAAPRFADGDSPMSSVYQFYSVLAAPAPREPDPHDPPHSPDTMLCPAANVATLLDELADPVALRPIRERSGRRIAAWPATAGELVAPTRPPASLASAPAPTSIR